MGIVASAGIGSWSGRYLECGRLRQGDGRHERGERCRRAFMLTTLPATRAAEVIKGAGPASGGH